MKSAIFNPRDGADGNTPDADWLNYLLVYTAFSLSGYNEKAYIAEDVLGKYYETARKLYTREYKDLKISADNLGIFIDGQYLPNQVGKILPDKYTSDPAAFAKSAYAQLLRDASSGSIPLSSDVMMVYGGQDELMSPDLATVIYERQSIGFAKENISLNIVNSANHRAAFLSSMSASLDWFNGKLVSSGQQDVPAAGQPMFASGWDQWFFSFLVLGVARGWDSGILKMLQLLIILKVSMAG